jgi:hypothetical protein
MGSASHLKWTPLTNIPAVCTKEYRQRP